jgi:hypothetical protein
MTLRNSLEVIILVFFQNFGKWRWLPVTKYSSWWRKFRRILSSGRARTIAYSNTIASETCQIAGFVMASEQYHRPL